MREDSSISEPADLGLGKDAEMSLGNGIHSLTGRVKCLGLSITVGTPETWKEELPTKPGASFFDKQHTDRDAE